jgi:uncharacterized repeat protein (TIGR01451 family)
MQAKQLSVRLGAALLLLAVLVPTLIVRAATPDRGPPPFQKPAETPTPLTKEPDVTTDDAVAVPDAPLDRQPDGTAPSSSPPVPPGCGAAPANMFSNNTPIDIPDRATVTSTLTIAGARPYLWDLDLTTLISHTYAADLDITLTSPRGTTVTVTTDNGGGNDDVFAGTHWDDDAGDTRPPGPITDATFSNGVVATRLSPEEPFGAFIGENPNGVWSLVVTDDLLSDTGKLNRWSLAIVTLPVAPITATTSHITTTTQLITDSATMTSTLTVAGAGSLLTDLNMTSVISHTYAADLDITLISPRGTTATVTTDNGSGNDDVFAGTHWDDDAGDTRPPGPITDATFSNGVVATPLAPEEPFGAFIGENPNGVWSLVITDDAAGDIGMLNRWSLEITTGLCSVAGADLALAKVDRPDPVTVSQPLTYTLTVQNNGPDNVTGVILTDTLPAGVSFSSATPSQGSCGRTGGIVTCSLGSLTSTTSATVNIRVRAPTSAGTITNTARVTAQQSDPTTSNNIASTSTEVVRFRIYLPIMVKPDVLSQASDR